MSEPERPPAPPAPPAPRPLRWLDRLKGFCLLWIFLNHAAEQSFGGPHLGNPQSDWPPLAERFAQLAPLTDAGAFALPLNLFRWFGWLGDQGVAPFILLSGFGLTWGLLQRGAPARLPLGEFLRTRLLRIYPAYWLAHVPFFALFLVTGWGLSLFDARSWASLLGLRVTPASLYYFSPAWWYVGLALQLYLLFPLLWWTLRTRGPRGLLVVGVVAPLLVRAVALHTTHDWLDLWSRGGIAVTRLPEFAAGMALAHAWHARPGETEAFLSRGRSRVLALALYVAGLAASGTLAGMVVAPLFLMVGLFPLLHAGMSRPVIRGPDVLGFVGRHAYALFLVHHPIVLKLMPAGFAGPPWGAPAIFARTGAAFVASVAGAIALERIAAPIESRAARLSARGLLLRLAVAAGLLVLSLVGAELAVRRFDPQEVDGWGERASLQPDPRFGWTLAPSRETRLRWQSYDYTVRANALGFPGPEPVAARTPGTRRVMTFGDAFTSAEGVDTEGSWPRLLEGRLRAQGPAEVQNFAITGYGPNQFAALARVFLPEFRPDVLVMTFFVNDFADAETSEAEFHEEIGFGRPLPEGPLSVLRLAYLERFVALKVQDRWNARRGAERVVGYGLGHFDKLLVQTPAVDAAQQARVRERYAEIAEAARAVGARVIVPLIPAAPQVCPRDSLPYFPPAVDLNDPKYDLDRPQRLALPLIREAGFEALDLRPVLKALPECPYQPANMHWRPAGHAAVAEAVAAALATP